MENNLTSKLKEQALKIPNEIILRRDNEFISYLLLEEYVCKCATFFYSLGLREGDVSFFIIEDEILFIVAMLASARIGATILPIQKSDTTFFLDSILKELNIKYLISDIRGLEKDRVVSIYVQKEFFLDTEINKYSFALDPKSPWCIIIGSGSTGKRKLIPEGHKQIIGQINLVINNLTLNKNDNVATFISINYASSQSRFLETLYSGGTFVILPKINENIVENLKKYDINILYSTVYHIEQLLTYLPQTSKQVLGFLKILSLGSSRISMDLRTRIKNQLTNNIYVRYSTNEVGLLCIASTIDNTLFTSESVGKVIKGIDLEIVDNNTNILEKNKIGHIRIKSPGLFSGYINDIESTKKVLKDGWFYPGDIGKLTDSNELVYLGRSDDMMIKNGVNIYPSLIENELLKSPYISEAIAFPLKHKIYQDLPVCIVVFKSGTDYNNLDLMSFAKRRLGVYSPSYIIALNKTPRNEQGKIIKKDLEEIVLRYIKKDLK